jgi:hypothetical protein
LELGAINDPSDHIISCYYYYYYSSSSSPNELVRPNSQRLMIRSLLNFTGKWISISRGAFWRPFECNFHHYQSIPHFKISLDINFHWIQRTLKFCRFCRGPFSKWRPFARDFFWSKYSTNPT